MGERWDSVKDKWHDYKDWRADWKEAPIGEKFQRTGAAMDRAGKAVISPLNPVGWVKNLMRKAPVLGVLLGAGAGAGIYSHFAQPQVTSLPEADRDALEGAQAQAQRDFLDKTPAMADPRIAPMQQAMQLQAQLGGPDMRVDAGTIAGTQRLSAPQQALGA